MIIYLVLHFPLMTTSILFGTLFFFFFFFTFSFMYLRNIWFPTWRTNTSVLRWNKNSLKPVDLVTVEPCGSSQKALYPGTSDLESWQMTRCEYWLVQNSAVSCRLWRWLTDPQRTQVSSKTLSQDAWPSTWGVCFSFGYF